MTITTTHSHRRFARPMILGDLPLLTLLGCTSDRDIAQNASALNAQEETVQPPTDTAKAPDPAPEPESEQNDAPEPATVLSPRGASDSAPPAAVTVTPDDLPTAAIESTPDPRPLAGPGARAVAAQLIAITGDQVLVQLNLTNRSRATTPEFTRFQDEFASLLEAAAPGSSLRVTGGAVPDEADFSIRGAAYLVTRDGFDQWEIYPRLRHSDEAWERWRPAFPIRMLRIARPDTPRITAWPAGE